MSWLAFLFLVFWDGSFDSVPMGDVIGQLDVFSRLLFLGFDYLRASIFSKYLKNINAVVEN